MPLAKYRERAARLGPGRWRLALPEAGDRVSRALYLTEKPRSCLFATIRGRRLRIRLRGELTGPAVLNLGDCLVRAMAEGMERITLCLGERKSVPLEAIGLMESFGRQMLRETVSCQCSIRGTGAGIDALALALSARTVQTARPAPGENAAPVR